MKKSLIDLNSRREKDSTVIILNRFSKKLIGFLSVKSKVGNLSFTTQKELLWAISESQAEEMIKIISKWEEFFVFIRDENKKFEKRLSSNSLRFEVAKIQNKKVLP